MDYNKYKQDFIKKYVECLKVSDHLDHHLDIGEDTKVYIDSEALLYIVIGKDVPDDIIYISMTRNDDTVTVLRTNNIETKTTRNDRVDVEHVLVSTIKRMDQYIEENS